MLLKVYILSNQQGADFFDITLNSYLKHKDNYIKQLSKFCNLERYKGKILIKEFINMPHKEEIDFNYKYSLPQKFKEFTEEEKIYYELINKSSKINEEFSPIKDIDNIKNFHLYTILNEDNEYLKTDKNTNIIISFNEKSVEIIQKTIENNSEKSYYEIIELLHKLIPDISFKNSIEPFYYDVLIKKALTEAPHNIDRDQLYVEKLLAKVPYEYYRKELTKYE